jgi:hypothetical protein
MTVDAAAPTRRQRPPAALIAGLVAALFDPADASFGCEAAYGQGFGMIDFEPATLAAVLAGLALLGRSRRRQPARC